MLIRLAPATAQSGLAAGISGLVLPDAECVSKALSFSRCAGGERQGAARGLARTTRAPPALLPLLQLLLRLSMCPMLDTGLGGGGKASAWLRGRYGQGRNLT